MSSSKKMMDIMTWPIDITPSSPSSVPNAAKREDARVEAAAAAEADRIRKKQGWASTWLTGPEGLGGSAGGLKTRLGE